MSITARPAMLPLSTLIVCSLACCIGVITTLFIVRPSFAQTAPATTTSRPGGAPTTATPEALALANVRALVQAVNIYCAEYQRIPEKLALVAPYTGSIYKLIHDPRLKTAVMAQPAPDTPRAALEALIEAQADFYYVLSGFKWPLKGRTDQMIIFYDKGAAGDKRILGFMDGHVAIYTAGTEEFKKIVAATNETRKAADLPLLPDDLKGPPK